MKINNEKFLDYLDEAVENGELTESEDSQTKKV